MVSKCSNASERLIQRLESLCSRGMSTPQMFERPWSSAHSHTSTSRSISPISKVWSRWHSERALDNGVRWPSVAEAPTAASAGEGAKELSPHRDFDPLLAVTHANLKTDRS